ncbi:hypothetical protein UM93_13380 [Psychromicrobium lacuslunae]|uniref:D-isomer specific 2-hydroxyacid dehydrogenase NAD-binding domain-containing protein n=2 Tax=Psychromicrobium lacuslunae TaxID=1618207 RepID=A0A0D4C3H2_9MICC|nr:hypothetical protein UM93_13380 [Psychromicrobium lacuslunae]
MDVDSSCELFGAAEWAELSQLVELSDTQPIQSFAEVDPAELAQLEVLITGWGTPRISATELSAMPKLRYVVHAAGTVKTFLAQEVFSAGIQVSSAAVANAVPVAEYTVASVIMGLKRATRFQHQLRSGGSFRDLRRMPPVGSFGVTVGVVGASQVGRKVLELLKNFELRTVVYDPYLSAAEATALGAEQVELEQLCRQSQVVSLHAPATPETIKMIGAAEMAAMCDGTVLINTARGSLLDTVALLPEVSSGRLDAFLDVTDPEPLPSNSPLYRLPNVFITPHIAGAMGNEVRRLGRQAISELHRLAQGQNFQYPVIVNDLSRIA